MSLDGLSSPSAAPPVISPHPRLSICIPTWQRASLLREGLEALVGFDPGCTFEVVVSDNASTDDTEAVARSFEGRLPLRYERLAVHTKTSNTYSAFRHARGEFTLYLADDDRLLVEGMREAIGTLVADPTLSAVCAPGETWDAGADELIGVFGALDANQTFGADEALRLLALLIDRQLFPEILVYRTSALLAVTDPIQWAYPSHPGIIRLLGQGRVALQRQPYYRNIARTTQERDRLREGIAQTLFFQDQYRAGLELAIWEAFRQTGHPAVPVEQQSGVYALIEQFVLDRLRAGAKISRSLGDLVRAAELGGRAALRHEAVPPPDRDAASRQAERERDALLAAAGEGHLLGARGRSPTAGEPSPRLTLCLSMPCDAEGLPRWLGSSAELSSAELVCVVEPPQDQGSADGETQDPTAAAREALSALSARLDASNRPVRLFSVKSQGADSLQRLVGMHAARGRYVLAVRSTEAVDGDQVAELLDWLDEHPSCAGLVCSSHAPDGDPQCFEPGQGLGLLDVMINDDVQPELAIYRTDALRPQLVPTQGASAAWQWWWAVAETRTVAVASAEVLFRSAPCREGLDELRAGLELALYALLGQRPHSTLEAGVRSSLLSSIEARMQRHLAAWARRSIDEGQAVIALESLARCRLYGDDTGPPEGIEQLFDYAAAELVARAVGYTSGRSSLVLCGVAPVVQSIFELAEPTIVPDVSTLLAQVTDDLPAIVLVTTAQEAAQLRSRFDPGQVMVWDEVQALVRRMG